MNVSPEPPIPEREVSLARRVLTVRTIGSILFGVALLFLLFRVLLDIDFEATWELIVGANPAFLLLALFAYYATFPIRGFRWSFVLGRVGTYLGVRDATQVVFVAWFVNCMLPAKLGDLYRAYLLRGNFGTPISRTVGTVFIERIADLMVMVWLALAAGYWSFRDRSRPEMDALFLAGFVAAGFLVVFVIALRYAGGRLTRCLPTRVADVYRLFHEGSTGPLTMRSVPVIGLVTAVVWMLEGIRLFFVIRALDLPGAELGITASIFVALAGSLLTAIPLTPAGIGFVEAGIVGALGIYGVPLEQGVAVAVADRAITILTVILLGGLVYAFSPMVRRAHGVGLETAMSPE
jgi:glycosyltransferase 2 family protein